MESWGDNGVGGKIMNLLCWDEKVSDWTYILDPDSVYKINKQG
ncbi:MAG: hypothetical protein PHI66_01815 [Candidatus Pacebacteria bacterium]|nr:hypothetical protein [Candidatus Paceibacterota bacterium]